MVLIAYLQIKVSLQRHNSKKKKKKKLAYRDICSSPYLSTVGYYPCMNWSTQNRMAS